MLKVKQFIFNPFEESTFLLIDEATRSAVVVDPGMFDSSEQRVFDDFIRTHNIRLTQIVNTHMHVDHCLSDNYVRDSYGVKVAASLADRDLSMALPDQARRFGFRQPVSAVAIDIDLKDGDIIEVGESRLEVIAVPGHSQGGIALYSAPDRLLIAGDSLFRGSIGRTDFVGGNHQQLVDNVRNRLLTLPDDTVVLPGHGPFTTIADEKRSNPFLR